MSIEKDQRGDQLVEIPRINKLECFSLTKSWLSKTITHEVFSGIQRYADIHPYVIL